MQIELESPLDQIVLRITRQLERAGLLVQDEGQPYLDLDSTWVSQDSTWRL